MRHDLDDSSIEERLAPGEVVLWRGKPVWKAFVFRTSLLFSERCWWWRYSGMRGWYLLQS